jgi:hypothetical protein
MMRMVSQASAIDLTDNFKFVVLQTAFDEGPTFIGMEHIKLNTLLHVVYGTVYRKLLLAAQKNPEDYTVRMDYLDPRSYLNNGEF